MINLLFWVGYSAKPWDGNTDTGLGGTDIAVINIAEGLASYGYKVTVAGQVKNSHINNVEWIDIPNFEAKYSAMPNHFDVVIGVSYLHFIKYALDNNQNKAKFIFWMHNPDYHLWYNGVELENHLELLSKIDLFLTPSNWSAKYVLENVISPNTEALQDFGIISQQVTYIPNGINLNNFKANVSKDPNKFIWSSAVDRGLSRLLMEWPRIKEIMPEATLDVYYPEYSNPHADNSWNNIEGIQTLLETYKDLGVTDMGSVSQSELHMAMMKATYWMYLTRYDETFCITALEMMAAGVLPICSNHAALGELVVDGVVLESDEYETMYQQAIEILPVLNREIIQMATDSAKERAKKYTWDIATHMWHNLIQSKLVLDLGICKPCEEEKRKLQAKL